MRGLGYLFLSVLALAWGIPFVALGIVLCVTIIGIPLGVLCFWLGCAPLAGVVRSAIIGYQRRQPQNSESLFDEEVDPPWLTEEDLL